VKKPSSAKRIKREREGGVKKIIYYYEMVVSTIFMNGGEVIKTLGSSTGCKKERNVAPCRRKGKGKNLATIDSRGL